MLDIIDPDMALSNSERLRFDKLLDEGVEPTDIFERARLPVRAFERQQGIMPGTILLVGASTAVGHYRAKGFKVVEVAEADAGTWAFASRPHGSEWGSTASITKAPRYVRIAPALDAQPFLAGLKAGEPVPQFVSMAAACASVEALSALGYAQFALVAHDAVLPLGEQREGRALVAGGDQGLFGLDVFRDGPGLDAAAVCAAIEAGAPGALHARRQSFR